MSDNLLPVPAGQGNGSIVRSINQSASALQMIEQRLRAIDTLLTSIGSKARGFPRMLNGGSGGGSSYDWESYSVAGSLPSGVRSGNGPNSYTIPGTERLPNPTPPALPPGGGGGGRGWVPYAAYLGVSGANSMLGSWVGQGTSFYSQDNIYAQLRGMGAGPPGQANRWAFPTQLAHAYGGGFLNTADLMQGLQTGINAGYGYWMGPNGGLSSNLRNAAIAMPGMGLAGVTGLMTSYATPGAQAIGMRYGIQAYNPMTGRPTGVDSFLQQVLNATGGMQHDIRGVRASFTPGGSMYYSLQQMGLNPQQIEQMQPLVEAAFQAHTNIDFGNQKFMHQLTKDGVTSRTEIAAMKRAGTAYFAQAGQYHGMVNGLDATNNMMGSFSNAVGKFEQAVQVFGDAIGAMKGGYAGLASGPNGGTALGHMLPTVANDFMQASMIAIMEGRGPLAGLGGKVGASRLGGLFGSEGALGLTALGPLALGLGAGGLGLLGTHLVEKRFVPKNNHVLRHIVGGVGGALSGAAVGAGVGEAFAPVSLGLSVPIGAAIGALGGALGWGAAGDSPSSSPVASGNAVVQFAERFVGTPYSLGGGGIGGPSRGTAQGANTVGFDCSSFIQFVMAHFGVSLPRTTFQQVKYGSRVADVAHARAGDLFFYGPASAPTHVAMYLGGGQMIEAPHTGADIHVTPVRTPSIIKRVLGGVLSGSPGTTSSGGSGAYTADGGAAASMAQSLASSMAPAGFLASTGGVLDNIYYGTAAGSSAGGSGAGASLGPGASVHLSGSVTPTSFAHSLLAALGAPQTSSNVAALVAWENAEGGNWHNTASFNPLDTTQRYGRSHVMGGGNSAGVQAYQSWQDGLSATVQTLRNGHYAGILSALAAGNNANAVARAVAQSPWGTGGFSVPGYSSGAWKIDSNKLAQIHEGEMILEKPVAQAVRQLVSSGSGGGGGAGCHVEITVQAGNASHAEAVKFAQTVKRLIEHDNHLDTVGSG